MKLQQVEVVGTLLIREGTRMIFGEWNVRVKMSAWFHCAWVEPLPSLAIKLLDLPIAVRVLLSRLADEQANIWRQRVNDRGHLGRICWQLNFWSGLCWSSDCHTSLNGLAPRPPRSGSGRLRRFGSVVNGAGKALLGLSTEEDRGDRVGIHRRHPPVAALAAWPARPVAASSIASAAIARAASVKPLPRLNAIPPGTITAAELMYCSDGGSTGSM